MAGGDALYADLRRDKSLAHKTVTILKMIVITELGYLFGMLFNKAIVGGAVFVLQKVGVGEL